MRLLGARTLFAAGEKEHQSYRDENGDRGTKHQMQQRGHSRLLAVIRDPARSTKVRHAPSLERVQDSISGCLKNGMGALNRSAGKRVRRIDAVGWSATDLSRHSAIVAALRDPNR